MMFRYYLRDFRVEDKPRLEKNRQTYENMTFLSCCTIFYHAQQRVIGLSRNLIFCQYLFVTVPVF